MGIMRSKASLVRTLVSVARMAASERALPASVPPMPPVSQSSRLVAFENHVGDFLRETVGRAGNSAADRLAEDEEIRVEIFGAGVAAGTGADGVRFVDDEQRAVLAREFSQCLMVAGIGMHDADVGQGRLGEHAGDVAMGQRLFQSARRR